METSSKKKVLFTATEDYHILSFHIPFLKLFKERGYEVHVATNGDEKIPFCDVKHVICFERSPFRFNNLKAIKQVKELCEKEKFDIIHTHTPMGATVTRLGARKSRKVNKTRVIYTAHGFHFFKGAPLLNWMLFYPVEKWLSKYTDTLILINPEDYDRAKRKFGRRCHDIQYVPGVGLDEKKFDIDFSDTEREKLRESLGLKDSDFVIIYPAELSVTKRQTWLINSISDFLKSNPKVHLLLPGRDSLHGECQNLAFENGIENQIHFLGYRKDIFKLLNISNLSISASKREGLPVNIMEAMFVGLPIVASNCRGNRDLVKDGVNGFLVDLDDSKRFEECVRTIYLENSDRFSKESKKLINDYTLSAVLPKMESIYFGE